METSGNVQARGRLLRATATLGAPVTAAPVAAVGSRA